MKYRVNFSHGVVVVNDTLVIQIKINFRSEINSKNPKCSTVGSTGFLYRSFWCSFSTSVLRMQMKMNFLFLVLLFSSFSLTDSFHSLSPPSIRVVFTFQIFPVRYIWAVANHHTKALLPYIR